MNKGITTLILGVIVCAMGLVFFLHMGKAPDRSEDFTQTFSNGTVENEAGIRTNSSVGSMPIVGSPNNRLDSGKVSSSQLQKPSLQAAASKAITSAVPEEPGQQAGAELKKSPVTVPQTTNNTSDQQSATLVTPSQTDAVSKMPFSGAVSGVEAKDTEPEVTVVNSTATKKTFAAISESGDNAQQQGDTVAEKEIKETKKPIAGGLSAGSPAPKSDTAAGISGTHTMKAASFHFSGAKIRFRVESNNEFSYRTMLLSEPDRLVIDFPGTWTDIKAPEVPKNLLVEKVRVGSQKAGPRFVLDLFGKPKKYEVVRISSAIVEFVVE